MKTFDSRAIRRSLNRKAGHIASDRRRTNATCVSQRLQRCLSNIYQPERATFLFLNPAFVYLSNRDSVESGSGANNNRRADKGITPKGIEGILRFSFRIVTGGPKSWTREGRGSSLAGFWRRGVLEGDA